MRFKNKIWAFMGLGFIINQVLEAIHLSKTLKLGTETLKILDDLSFKISKGSFCSISGPSGSGKSTLLSLLAGLDKPSAGQILFNDKTELSSLSEDEGANLRAKNMGFVFQNFRLVPSLSALENVALPLEILEQPNSEKEAELLLNHVGLSKRLGHLPSQLSGGEQQRVALARAFAIKPKLLFADEPTGNLDSKNGAMVLDLMLELKREYGSTLVIVTHDPEIAQKAEQQFKLLDGRLI